MNWPAATTQPHWLVAYLPYGKLVSSRELRIGTDMVKTFLEAMLQYHNDGYTLQEFSSFNGEFFVVSKFGERLRVTIIGVNPKEPPPRYVGHMEGIKKTW
jgi:hypothetical protein